MEGAHMDMEGARIEHGHGGSSHRTWTWREFA